MYLYFNEEKENLLKEKIFYLNEEDETFFKTGIQQIKNNKYTFFLDLINRSEEILNKLDEKAKKCEIDVKGFIDDIVLEYSNTPLFEKENVVITENNIITEMLMKVYENENSKYKNFNSRLATIEKEKKKDIKEIEFLKITRKFLTYDVLNLYRFYFKDELKIEELNLNGDLKPINEETIYLVIKIKLLQELNKIRKCFLETMMLFQINVSGKLTSVQEIHNIYKRLNKNELQLEINGEIEIPVHIRKTLFYDEEKKRFYKYNDFREEIENNIPEELLEDNITEGRFIKEIQKRINKRVSKCKQICVDEYKIDNLQQVFNIYFQEMENDKIKNNISRCKKCSNYYIKKYQNLYCSECSKLSDDEKNNNSFYKIYRKYYKRSHNLKGSYETFNEKARKLYTKYKALKENKLSEFENKLESLYSEEVKQQGKFNKRKRKGGE